MPGLDTWAPHTQHVQGGLPEGNFVNAQFILICAGPPFFANLAGNNGLVYPIGITQNFAVSQNKQISRIFEIGSDRSYFISGRSVGQLSLSRIVYHGPSLLRVMYAYYNTVSASGPGVYKMRPLFDTGGTLGVSPFDVQGADQRSSTLHDIRIPPGFDNMFLNLASDLFSQPLGLLLILRDNNETDYARCYFEQCYIPQHQMAMDSNGLIMQESVSIQYERILPLNQPSIQLALVNGLLPDATGGYPSGQDLL